MIPLYMFLDSSHLQKPIHADVLLRIESTTSESSNTEKTDQSEITTKNVDQRELNQKTVEKKEVSVPSQLENIEINNMQLIEDIEKIEISSGNAGSSTPSIKSDSVKSDDEGNVYSSLGVKDNCSEYFPYNKYFSSKLPLLEPYLNTIYFK